MKIWVDPPEGWRYGFPKILDKDVETYEQLLRKSGYPEKDMEFALTYCRQWSVNENTCNP